MDRTLALDKPEGGGSRVAQGEAVHDSQLPDHHHPEDGWGEEEEEPEEGEKACDTDVTVPAWSPGSPSKGDLS